MASPVRSIRRPFFPSGSPWLACAALAVLAGAFLAACQSSSSCGGMSSGYQTDALERPGLMACSSSTSSSSSTPVNPNDGAALNAALSLTYNGVALNTFVADPAVSATSPILLNLEAPTANMSNTGLSGSAQDYPLTIAGATTNTLYYVYCRIGGQGQSHYNTAAFSLGNGSYTLHVAYPTFSAATTSPFTLQCYGRDAAGAYTIASNALAGSG